MALFQKSIIQRFTKKQSTEKLEEAYERFKENFMTEERQQNILKAKEQQYQEGFLKDLFVDVLGYTLFPQTPHNLITELKNPNDARRVDGAVIREEQALAVIELKDTRTKVLKMVEPQAFGYKYQHPNCRYVITSNFQELWFYVDNAYEHIEFDLFDMSLERFALFYTILHADNLLADVPVEMKKESIVREEELTLEFYNDYQGFKDMLYLNIAQYNLQYDKLMLFEKTQRIIDRIIFMCFASDKNLLPPNLIPTVIEEWKRRLEEGEITTLYTAFKRHFRLINRGFKSRKYDIYGYNGGLFAQDEVLENLKISDEVLENNCLWLTKYDFDTEIDINVLGHIFEHSLSDLEQKKQELLEDLEAIKAGNQPKNAGKRKEDGIFYTPIYVTQYMVDETVGKLCQAQKEALQIEIKDIDWDDEDQKQTLLERIQAYEKWIAKLYVLDPACGSGAFLNQVLSFFTYEYDWIDSIKMGIDPETFGRKEWKTKIELGNIFEAPQPRLEKPKDEKPTVHKVLENNVFGVDLNMESVSITKLSLWLKTAQMRQKLNNLSDNIKIGNSLVDDPEIDPRAFDWKAEFPQVFTSENSGFSVVIGNPPYVRQERLAEKMKVYFKDRYPNVYSGVADLYVYFYARGLELLLADGILGYITPNKWFKTKYGFKLRQLLKPYEILHVVDFFELPVFEDAATEPQIITLYNRKSNKDFEYYPVTKELIAIEGIEKFAKYLEEKYIIDKSLLQDSEWILTDRQQQLILHKIQSEKTLSSDVLKIVSLKEYTNDSIHYGVKTGLNKAFIIDRKTREELIRKDARSAELIKPYLHGIDIKKWHIENAKEYFLIFTRRGTDIERYPVIKKYLLQFREDLEPKENRYQTNGRKPGSYNWFELQDTISYYERFEQPKLMYIHTALNHYFYYDTEGYYTNNSGYIIAQADWFLCAFLNSKLFEFFKRLKFVAYGDPHRKGRNKLDYNKMIQVPVPVLKEGKKAYFEEKIKALQTWSSSWIKAKSTFLKVVLAEFDIEKPSRKLKNWYKLDWAKFQKELEKKQVRFRVKQKLEWVEDFESEKQKLRDLEKAIHETEQEVDYAIYALYQLTPAEIAIVEAQA